MKALTVTLISGIIFCASSAQAGEFKFVAGNDSTYTKFCVAAANNNLMQYNQQVDNSGLSDRHVAQATLCNGENIANFAAKYNAQRTAKHINRYRRGNVTITDFAAVKHPIANQTTIVTIN